MKKKLIAVILSLCVAGGAATTFVVNNQSKDKIAQIEEKTEDKQDEASIETKDNETTEKVTEESVVKVEESEDSVQDNEVTSLNNEVESSNNVEETVNEPIVYSMENSNVNDNVDNSDNNSNVQNNTSVNESEQNTSNSKFMEQVESMIISMVNEERAKNGLAALSYNSTMEHYARYKSQDMGDRGYFDHNNPEGELITAQMARDGVSYSAWGENIAYIGGVTDVTALANQFMTNWMNSSGHRANILSGNFTSIGVGVYKVGNTVYATQEFYR